MINQITKQLRNTAGRNDKIAILESHKDNQELQLFFKLALDPFILFYQKKPIAITKNLGISSLHDAMNAVQGFIATRTITGNSAIDYCKDLMENLSVDDAEVIQMILAKNPDCGVSDSTVNKVWTKLIPEYPCMLASQYDQKLFDKLDWKSGVFIQEKMDGMRCNIVINESGSVSMFSRNGKELLVHGEFDFIGATHKSIVLDGELLYIDESGVANRQTGNGICNKSVKQTISKEEASKLVFVAWDCVAYNEFLNGVSVLPYKDRFDATKAILRGLNSNKLRLVPSEVVNAAYRAMELNSEYQINGSEGIIAKDPNMIWENKRSKKQIKLKAELTATLEVIATYEGTGKYSGMLGGITVKTKCGQVTTNVGSGFTDANRASLTNLVGKFVEIKYNAVITDVNGKLSLFLPIYLNIREDKDVADSLICGIIQ